MHRRVSSLLALTIMGLAGCSSGEGTEEGQSTSNVNVLTADNCLGSQDMDAPDVDVSACPPLPEIPESAMLGADSVSLGAWELGTTSNGATYKYGSLSSPDSNPRSLEYDDGTAEVNAQNLECWAKGYYRLRKMLQDPPREYVALRDAGFQGRFFQFQTDLRNGPTGFKKISSYQDHLVKWVTVISPEGVCEQPTLSKFKSYAASELNRRGIAPPADPAPPSPTP